MGLLELVIVILVLAWAFGFWGPYHLALGGLVHILLVVAVIVILVRVIQGRRPL